MFRGLSAIVYKELIQIRRDPSTRFVFLVPVLQLIIFGYAIDMDVQRIPTVVFDMDASDASRRLVERFENTRTFDVVEQVHGDEALRAAIVAGRAKIGIVIPPDYAADLLRGRQARVQVLVDGSDSTVANNAVQTALGIGQIQSLAQVGLAPEELPLDLRPRVLFNPDLLSARFYVPGLVGIILQVVTVFLTAFAIVRERERGTLEQLSVTPIPRMALVVGKIVPYAVIGMAQAVIVLVFMRYLFQVPIRGDVFLLLALSILFLLPALAMGILISTVAANQAHATQLGILVMLPSVLLSGFAFPRETMPLAIYALTFFIPVTYYIEILRGIILRGAGLDALWPETLALAAFTVVLVVASALRFQKRVT